MATEFCFLCAQKCNRIQDKEAKNSFLFDRNKICSVLDILHRFEALKHILERENCVCYRTPWNSLEHFRFLWKIIKKFRNFN